MIERVGQHSPIDCAIEGRLYVSQCQRRPDCPAERERASQELAWIVDEAGPQLERVLEAKPSAETQRRLELLLKKRSLGISGKELRLYRVIEVLEHIADGPPGADATRLAVDLLKKFAGGAPDARMTQEAKASLERLELRTKIGR